MSGTQVIVVGSGGGGMAAAAAAAIAGATVTVLEAQPTIGGTTAISGGAVWMPATRWQTEAGITDTLEEGLRHVAAIGIGDSDAELSRVYVTEGPGVFEEIERVTPLRWHVMAGFPDYQSELDGGSVRGRGLEIMPLEPSPEARSMLREDPYGVPPALIGEANDGLPSPEELADRIARGLLARGPGLIAGLCGVVLEHGGQVLTDTRAERLVVEDGVVVGVQAAGRELRGAVILASGGFERDPELVKRFLRGPMLAPAGPPGNRGDGLRMGMAAGASLGNMSEAWWAPAMESLGEEIDGAPFHRILFTDCAHPGGILVDGRGRRFVNEASNYSDLGRGFHAYDAGRYGFPGTNAWLVFDARRKAERGFAGDTVWSLSPDDPQPDATDEPVPSWMRTAATVEALAQEIGVPADALRETVERYNDGVAAGADPDFGRGSFNYDAFSQGPLGLRAVEQAPFFAIRVLPGALGTKGGLRTDAHGRVLTLDDTTPIPGLYAAGNVAASPFGFAYPGPGATVGPAVVFGWRAGVDAAQG